MVVSVCEFMRVPFGREPEYSDRSRNVPFWELLVHTPAVFVRVANKGVTGYGTWKSGEAIEKTEVRTA